MLCAGKHLPAHRSPVCARAQSPSTQRIASLLPNTPQTHRARDPLLRGARCLAESHKNTPFVKAMFCPRHISYFFPSRYSKRQALDNPPPPRERSATNSCSACRSAVAGFHFIPDFKPPQDIFAVYFQSFYGHFPLFTASDLTIRRTCLLFSGLTPFQSPRSFTT